MKQMGEKMIKYTLPEWTFLGGNSHEGDFIKGRSILMHIPSFSILEVIPVNKLKEVSFKYPTFQFQILDNLGHRETLQFYIHCSLSPDLDQLFQDSAIWYYDYLREKAGNDLIKEKSKQN